jgi:hypothetical protein
MISLINLYEQSQPSNSKTAIITNAIKNKKPLTFFYTGPRSPKKDSVKPGYRIKGESVALGLSQKGNLIVRMFVKPPSTSKKGFNKHGWRTFIVDRMSQLKLHDDETFDLNRPLYKEGDDNSMTVTYVKSDNNISEPTQTNQVEPIPTNQVEPSPTNQIEPTQQVEPQPTSDNQSTTNNQSTTDDQPKEIDKEVDNNLPQPPKETKPLSNPNLENDINLEIKKYVKDNENKKQVSVSDLEKIKKQIYTIKERSWREEQLKLNKTSNAGEGTRRRLSNEASNEIDNILNKNNIEIINDLNINEDIIRIKTLILY